ncbi:hypothetical protein J4226_03780 [Candidatus Pacearchaeota archaeon]|nr:hypothetical protein [Candidatus Pacearchaeota archaeon]
MDYLLEFYEAKYHLSVAQRMLGIYEEYAEKRVLVGVIREGAKAAGKLVRAFLIREGVKGNLKTFVDKVAPKYLNEIAVLNLVNILEVERAQRICKVEFARKDEVLMEVNGDWKILKVSRLREFVESVSDIVSSFPTDIKR